jgi:hypothetical protein
VATALLLASSAVTVMLKAVPAVGLGVAAVTEKWVATGGGVLVVPHPLNKPKLQIEINSSNDLFMTPSQAFEAFLVIRSYLHMRKPQPKAIMAIHFLLPAPPPQRRIRYVRSRFELFRAQYFVEGYGLAKRR